MFSIFHPKIPPENTTSSWMKNWIRNWGKFVPCTVGYFTARKLDKLRSEDSITNKWPLVLAVLPRAHRLHEISRFLHLLYLAANLPLSLTLSVDIWPFPQKPCRSSVPGGWALVTLSMFGQGLYIWNEGGILIQHNLAFTCRSASYFNLLSNKVMKLVFLRSLEYP